MSLTTDDLGRRFKDAAKRVAERKQRGPNRSFYGHAAYGGDRKAAAGSYGQDVGAVIGGEPRVMQRYDQRYPLQFKVAEHHEARRRNDTIVSWHQEFHHAREWAKNARACESMLEGEAPAGTFGGLDTHAVGIDTNVSGDTSTKRIAQAAEAEFERQKERALVNNPYI